MIPYRSDREKGARIAGSSALTRRRVVDYCRVTAAL